MRGNLRLPVFQKIQGILELKEGKSHIIFTYPRQSFFTRKKSWRAFPSISSSCAHVVCCLILYDSPFYSLLSIFSLIFHFILLIIFILSGTRTLRTLANEDFGILAENDPLTGNEPNDLHISETTEIFIQESSSDTVPSYLLDAELDDETIGRVLSSALFTQEREEPASRRQAYHSLEKSLLPSQSLSVGHVRTGRPVSDEFGSLISKCQGKSMSRLSK